MKVKFALGILAFTFVASASAQVVVPNHLASTDADSNFFLLVAGTTTRTYQETIAASQLTSLVGTNLTGVQWRLNAGEVASWPPTGGSISDFQVWIGAGVAPTSQSTTFASNYTSGPTQVRAGLLSFNAGDFSVGGTPNAWGPTITFNTGYNYTGGNLTIEYRFTGMPTGTSQPNMDAGAAETGQGTNYVAQFAASNTATTSIGLNGRFVVTRFTSTPVPEPASMAALALGAVALVRRRKK